MSLVASHGPIAAERSTTCWASRRTCRGTSTPMVLSMWRAGAAVLGNTASWPVWRSRASPVVAEGHFPPP